MFPGAVRYGAEKILLTNLESHNINGEDVMNHDECLAILRTFNSSSQTSVANETIVQGVNNTLSVSDGVTLMKSNYPWVFKNISELTENQKCSVFDKQNKIRGNTPGTPECEKIAEIVEPHKILVIPPARILGPRSLIGHHQLMAPDKFGRGLQQTILLDKFAHYLELLNIMVERNHITEKERNLQYSSLVYRNKSVEIAEQMENYCKLYEISAEEIQARVNSTIRFMRTVCSIPGRNDLSILSSLQGRDSEMRSVIPKKVDAFRAQVILNPALLSNQIVLPVDWAHKLPSLVYYHRGLCGVLCEWCLKFNGCDPIPEFINQGIKHDLRIAPDNEIFSKIPEKFIYKLTHATLLAKRDPVINMASVSMHTEVIFCRRKMISVAACHTENKAEDFDGDSEIIFPSVDVWATVEQTLNCDTRHNMLIYNLPRITFTESLILYMHRRQFSDNAFRFARLYKWIRSRETYKWLSDTHNRNAVERIANMSNVDWNVYSYAEPTRLILTQTLVTIAMVFGARAANDFYEFLLQKILQIANQLDVRPEDNPIYDPALPADYTMTNNLLNPVLMAICVSEARGCIESYDLFLHQLQSLDDTTEITPNIKTMKDEKSFFNNVTSITQSMAKKSRLVRVNGHNFFKTTIGFETISFHNHAQTIMYGDRCILHQFEMLNSILLPPHVAAMLTFTDEFNEDSLLA